MSFTQSLIGWFLLTLLISGGVIMVLKPDSAYSVSASFPKSDSLLLAQIQAKIALYPALAASQLKVAVTNGAVNISGEVAGKAQAITLIILAESIAGVQAVTVSGLSLQEGSLTGDDLINSQVIGTFNREGLMGPLSQKPIVTSHTGIASATYATPPPPIHLQVKTKDRVVYLSGSAPTQAAVDKAIDLAKSIPGVNEVRSAIIIAP